MTGTFFDTLHLADSYYTAERFCMVVLWLEEEQSSQERDKLLPPRVPALGPLSYYAHAIPSLI